jgi:hypothetical protein
MAITDEIGIEGHEPRSTSELYPNLSESSELCSDLAYLAPLPTGQFLSVHHQIPIRPNVESADSILTWSMP